MRLDVEMSAAEILRSKGRFVITLRSPGRAKRLLPRAKEGFGIE